MSCTPKDLLSPFEVHLDTLPSRGNVLLANCTLQAGHLVLSNQPFTRVLLPSLWEERCFSCFSHLGEKGIPSNGIWYCTKQCQQADASHHQVEGPLLSDLREKYHSDGFLSDMILVSRTLRKMRCPNPNPNPSDSSAVSSSNSSPNTTPIKSTANDVRALVHHDLSNNHGALELAQQVVSSGLLEHSFHDSTTKSNDKTEQLILTTLRQFACNNFAVTSNLLVAIGSAVCPAGAILNHSCAPNCAVTWNDVTGCQEIRTTRTVEAGEELTHSYLDVAATTEERRRKLLDEYNFVCECERCAGDGPTMVELPLRLQEELEAAMKYHEARDGSGGGGAAGEEGERGDDKSLQTMVASLRSVLQTSNYHWELDNCMRGDLLGVSLPGTSSSSSDDLCAVQELIENVLPSVTTDQESHNVLSRINELQSRWLHPLHLDQLSLTNELLTITLARMDYESAARHLERILAVYECIYQTLSSYHHPMVGLQFYTRGSLLSELKQHEEAAKELSRALKILRTTHGTGAPLVVGLEDLLRRTKFAVTRCCSKCKSSCEKLRPCKCKNVQYCNEQCQKRHWKEHKEEHRRLLRDAKGV